MTKRLQVLLDDAELRTIQRLARRDKLTTAEWVRRRLREGGRQRPPTRRPGSRRSTPPTATPSPAPRPRSTRCSTRSSAATSDRPRDPRRLEHPDVPGRGRPTRTRRPPGGRSRRPSPPANRCAPTPRSSRRSCIGTRPSDVRRRSIPRSTRSRRSSTSSTRSSGPTSSEPVGPPPRRLCRPVTPSMSP